MQVIVQSVADEIRRKNLDSTECQRIDLPEVIYEPTIRDMMRFHAITMMKVRNVFNINIIFRTSPLIYRNCKKNVS